jgi:hypothetical protein
MRYLARFLDASDPSASLKHAAYAMVVCGGCFWLSWDMIRGPINAEWCVAFGMLLGAVTTGKIVGAAAPPAPAAGVVPGSSTGAAGSAQ